jgi:hypothetical protein
MIKMKLNGVEIPRKILGNGWDELVDQDCLINWIKAGRLLEFRADGRTIFLGNKNSEFILDINDIDSLHIIR